MTRMRLVADFAHLENPGDFFYSYDNGTPVAMVILLPTRDFASVNLPGSKNERPIWQWDGNIESPTLSPSVRCHGIKHWHGFIVNGELRPCADSDV